MRLFQPMLLREADYLHPQLRSFKPIFIIVPCHIGKKHMYFFPLIPSTVKLVKCVHRIVLSMWVNMPEEEAVGWNSIFIHLMKGLPSPGCKICQSFPAFSFCCSEFHIVNYTGSQKWLRERLVGVLVSRCVTFTSVSWIRCLFLTPDSHVCVWRTCGRCRSEETGNKEQKDKRNNHFINIYCGFGTKVCSSWWGLNNTATASHFCCHFNVVKS